MNEDKVKKNPDDIKVMNAIVKHRFTLKITKKKLLMLSKDGKKYLPMKAPVVKRAMTLYDTTSYEKPKAIVNSSWGSGRIDFQPWPFPSATKLIVNELQNTLVGGDSTFLADLDPDFVTQDLVDYEFVKNAMDLHTGWKDAPGFNADSPFDREEIISL